MGRAHAECRRLISTHAPAGGATSAAVTDGTSRTLFLLTPLREGRPLGAGAAGLRRIFLLTPLREGRPGRHRCGRQTAGDFYSRPCGRGDCIYLPEYWERLKISTHAPAGGATCPPSSSVHVYTNFYSRPCGRGDLFPFTKFDFSQRFLLTPLREGRRAQRSRDQRSQNISTHAPAGGATCRISFVLCVRRNISTHAPAGGAT